MRFDGLALLTVILRGLFSCIVPICISLITYYAKEAGISPAVVQSFNSFSSFMTAVVFYYLYQEKLTKQHLVGMLLIIASVFIVAISKTLLKNADDRLYLAALTESADSDIAPA